MSTSEELATRLREYSSDVNFDIPPTVRVALEDAADELDARQAKIDEAEENREYLADLFGIKHQTWEEIRAVVRQAKDDSALQATLAAVREICKPYAGWVPKDAVLAVIEKGGGE